MHEIRLRKQIETEAAFDLPFARERLWPILSRTEWLNRAMGLPPVTYEMTKAPGGGSNVKARATFAGLSFVWEERPFQWLENEFYQVERFFESGPLIRANLIWKFEELAKDATRLRVISQFEARNPLCGFLMKHLLDPKATRDVARVVRHFEEHLRGDQPIALPKLATRPVAEAAFESALGKLRASGQRPELVGKLAAMVREAPDIFAARIRPFAVAKSWGMDEWEVLRLFLHATRAGLLSLSWEVLCPNCRLTRQPLTDSLAEVKQAMHCESCQINYDAEFDKSVELRFAVHPGVRACDTNTFCLAGPGARPHIVAQIHLLPGETRAWPWPKEAALYRLRSPQIAQSRTIEPAEFAKWRAGSFALSAEKIESVEGNSLEVENRFTHPVQLVLERMESAEPILTASRVTNWQEFRDLFAREVISPREQIVVGEQIVLFTDLRGSTAMYCGIGDAPAYALVREHFGVLQAAISEFHGSVVKTIGDAVMAVFTRVEEALGAVEKMHADLAARGEALPLQLKSALHLGPCLAVNANDKLDYFGTTINLAARLVDRSSGGDLVVSDAFFQRPETQTFARSRAAEAISVQFRGFTEAMKVWKIPILNNREKI